jgi:hypothetical protein
MMNEKVFKIILVKLLCYSNLMDNSIEKFSLLSDISENFYDIQFLINKIGVENIPSFMIIGISHVEDIAQLRDKLNERFDLCVKALEMGFDVDEYPEYNMPPVFKDVDLSGRARILFKLLD